MARREKLRKGAEPYLTPGEVIQSVFPGVRPGEKVHDRCVVATDRRLLLMKVNFLGKVTGIEAETNRHTRLGPSKGLLYPLPVFGVSVAHRFRNDLVSADRAAGFEPI